MGVSEVLAEHVKKWKGHTDKSFDFGCHRYPRL
jgi:hypothetical protein